MKTIIVILALVVIAVVLLWQEYRPNKKKRK